MLTLDALARMAERMPSEPFGEAGRPPYRRPDGDTRVRYVRLPPVAEERRRALSLFVAAVGGSVAMLTAGGLVATHGAELATGALPALDALARTAAWFAGWTAIFMAPFAAIGLWREVRRYRQVRARVGACGWLDSDGTLSSEDGGVAVSLRSSSG